jgi:hypothetical protein
MSRLRRFGVSIRRAKRIECCFAIFAPLATFALN